MTKKLLAVLVAVMVMLTAVSGTFALAKAPTPTDVPPVVEPVVLKLDANTGTGDEMAPVESDADGKVTVPAVTYTKNNFVFEGWNTSPDGSGDAYKAGDVLTITETTTLYAQWIKEGVEIVDCTVTYDANGGQGELIDEFSPYTQNMIVDTLFNTFTREGYLFKEWNTKADGTGESYEEFASFDIWEDTVLYAIWEKDPDYVEPEVPADDELVDPAEEDETVTDTDSDNPGTGETAAVAVALALSAVAMGAVVLLKKKAD